MRADVAHIRFKYVIRDPNRHGKVRYYFRPPGCKKVRLPDDPTSPEFAKRHRELMAGTTEPEPRKPSYGPGSLGKLIQDYLGSVEFAGLARSTQIKRRGLLIPTQAKVGTKPAAGLRSANIRAGRDARAETPGAANNWMVAMSSLYDWAIERGELDSNPVRGVKRLRLSKTGWHTWTPQERDAFCLAHPIGTMARTAFALHYYASLRASDVVRAGRQHRTADGYLALSQTKTAAPVYVWITPELAETLDASPSTGLHFIETTYGKPQSAKGYTRTFRRWREQAGLPEHCTSHGIRKSSAVTMAEAGASENVVGAGLGQTGTDSVKHYTKAAEAKRLARMAAETLSAQKVPPVGTDASRVGTNQAKKRG